MQSSGDLSPLAYLVKKMHVVVPPSAASHPTSTDATLCHPPSDLNPRSPFILELDFTQEITVVAPDVTVCRPQSDLHPRLPFVLRIWRHLTGQAEEGKSVCAQL